MQTTKQPIRSDARRPSPCALLATCLLVFQSGCASIPPEEREAGDAYEPYNRTVYEVNEDLDRVALAPASRAYVDAIPDPVRASVSSFFDNLLYLDTILNGFLQGKFEQGVSDLARFGVNSTIGIVGLFDVATPIGLPRHDEDFGQTLAVWGVGSGEFLMYPLLGPSSERDTGGIIVSLATNPLLYVIPPVAIPLGVMQVIDTRARSEGFVRFRDDAAIEPYAFTRDAYLQHRVYEIHDGHPPRASIHVDPVGEPTAKR